MLEKVSRMYINALNIWTTYDKFNSVSNINNKDMKWVCSDLQHTHTHARTHARTHAHTRTHRVKWSKDNEETEARRLKIVFEQVFYEDSFKRGSKIGSSQSLYLVI